MHDRHPLPGVSDKSGKLRNGKGGCVSPHVLDTALCETGQDWHCQHSSMYTFIFYWGFVVVNANSTIILLVFIQGFFLYLFTCKREFFFFVLHL